MNKFRGNVLGLSEDEMETQKKTDVRAHVKCLLREDAPDGKHELLGCLKSKIYLKKKLIFL